MRKGFTLIEFMIGMVMTVAIFIVATNFVVSFFSVDTKSRRSQEVEAAKSDISSEITNALQWGKAISFSGGVLTANGNTYDIENGIFRKNGEAFSSDTVKASNFQVTSFSSATGSTGTGTGTGLMGRYYNEMDFTQLVATQIDPEVHFIWSSGGKPIGALQPNTFSIQWSGDIEAPESGSYRFSTQSDDGVRLWVNNQLIIDNWQDHGVENDNANITLNGGQHYPIRVEYFQRFGPGRIYLSWARPTGPLEIIPQQYLYTSGSTASYQVHLDFEHTQASSIKDAMDLYISPRFDTSGSFPVPSATPPMRSDMPRTPKPSATFVPTPTPLR